MLSGLGLGSFPAVQAARIRPSHSLAATARPRGLSLLLGSIALGSMLAVFTRFQCRALCRGPRRILLGLFERMEFSGKAGTSSFLGLPQTGGLQQQKLNFSHCWRAEVQVALSVGLVNSEDDLSQDLPVSGGCWQPLAFLGLLKHHPPLCVRRRPGLFPVCLSIPHFCKDTNPIGLGVHRTPAWPHLNSLHLQ